MVQGKAPYLPPHISSCRTSADRTKTKTPFSRCNINGIAMQKRRYYHAKAPLLPRNINAIAIVLTDRYLHALEALLLIGQNGNYCRSHSIKATITTITIITTIAIITTISTISTISRITTITIITTILTILTISTISTISRITPPKNKKKRNKKC